MSYESRDVSMRIIGISAAIIAAGLALSLAVSAWWMDLRESDTTRPRAARMHASFADRTWEKERIREVRKQLELDAARHLESYGWVDREAGVAHIPIDRAMELVTSGVKPVADEDASLLTP